MGIAIPKRTVLPRGERLDIEGAPTRSRLPGFRWRVLVQEDGAFDELVIDRWLHLEQMNDRNWFLSLGPLYVSIQLNADDTCDVLIDGRQFAHVGGRVDITKGSDTGGKSLPSKRVGRFAGGWRVRRPRGSLRAFVKKLRRRA